MARKSKVTASGADASEPASPAEGTGAGTGGGKGARRPVGLRIGDLVARVTETTGARRGAARGIVEAALAEIGETLGRGEAVILPGLGRFWVTRTTENNGRKVLTAKMVHAPAGAAPARAAEPLADEGAAG